MKQQKLNELHLFAGAGGGILGGILCGHTTVCAVEIEPYCRKVLLQRQRDEVLPRFPIWDDVRTFDGRPWRGKVDIVCGGFPCQDISSAGKGAGIEGERSGMWVEMARIISEIRPSCVLVENSPMLTSRGLGRVLGDLAEMGYDAQWGVLGANHAGAPHKRDRIWIVGDSNKVRFQRGYLQQSIHTESKASEGINRGRRGNWDVLPKPYYIRSSDGVASRMDRLKAIGNGQVPAVAHLAWETLTQQQ